MAVQTETVVIVLVLVAAAGIGYVLYTKQAKATVVATGDAKVSSGGDNNSFVGGKLLGPDGIATSGKVAIGATGNLAARSSLAVISGGISEIPGARKAVNKVTNWVGGLF